jgi:DNA-binding NtrC family response regulator
MPMMFVRLARSPEQMPKLLIIEDDEQIRELVGSILEADYDIFATASLDEAEALWAENRSQISIVLSDLCLPDAKSTISRLCGWQAQYPRLVTVFVSGLPAASVRTDFGLINGVDFLSKPFRVSELREIVAGATIRFASN